MTTRREAIFGLAGLWALYPGLVRAASGRGRAFSWEWLQQHALALSRERWQAPDETIRIKYEESNFRQGGRDVAR